MPTFALTIFLPLGRSCRGLTQEWFRFMKPYTSIDTAQVASTIQRQIWRSASVCVLPWRLRMFSTRPDGGSKARLENAQRKIDHNGPAIEHCPQAFNRLHFLSLPSGAKRWGGPSITRAVAPNAACAARLI